MSSNEPPEPPPLVIPDEQPALQCSVSRRGSAVVVAVADELDLLTVPEFSRTLTAIQAAAAGPVVLDLTAVTFLDSSGINAIVRASRDADDNPTRLRVVADGPTVLKTIQLAGAHELITLVPTVDDALALP
ncbi:STAS domain-containing protein [Amycolatopsis sp. NBC_00348]|uniref:STAS domain-containing protein n=1 Tax=unclassified Amycolatopsis TaxID=2618356 RepID=UPI002E0F4EAE|nr:MULTISPECIES: STAS domain-containing protein [unclassified Amycolatopsis]WSJ73331.1 STAS domain-containing protein [Amycolatopsis sp. NBC_01307]